MTAAWRMKGAPVSLMATDLTFPVREAVVRFLRAEGSLTALIAASRIYGQEVPPNAEYPYVRFGAPTALPREWSCEDGSTVTADLHIFARNEAEACVIAQEIVTVLDDARLDLGGGRGAVARWTGGPTMRDPEDEELWHAVRTFDYEAA